MNVEANATMNLGVCGSKKIEGKKLGDNCKVCSKGTGEKRVNENGGVQNGNIGVPHEEDADIDENEKSNGDSAPEETKVHGSHCVGKKETPVLEKSRVCGSGGTGTKGVSENGVKIEQADGNGRSRYAANIETKVSGTDCKANSSLQSAGAEGLLFSSIVEIFNSDDDCAPGGDLSGKNITSQGFVENANSGQKAVENRTRKRKKASCLNVDENDNDVKKPKESVHVPDGSPSNPSLGKSVSSGTTVMRRYERNSGMKSLKSRSILFSEESSSSSDSEHVVKIQS